MTDNSTAENLPGFSTSDSEGYSPSLSDFVSRIAKLEIDLLKTKYELDHSLDHTNIAIRIINKDFTVRRVNRAFADMSGSNQKALEGKKCWDVFHSSLCHTENCRLERILNGEKFVEVEIERLKTDGTLIPCIVTASPILDSSGLLTGVVERFRDISESRRLQRQIQESEERYRALVKLDAEAGEAIVMLRDIGGKEAIHIFVNDQWPRITGYTESELLGNSFFDLESPSDREASIARYHEKLSGKALPGLYEITIIRKDGALVPVEITSATTVYQGERATVAYIRAITERKQAELALRKSENLYRTIFNTTGTATFIMDGDGIVTLVNREWITLFGYSREEAEGKIDLLALVPPDIAPVIRHNFDLRKVAPLDVPSNYHSQIITKTGSVLDVIVDVNMIPDTEMRVVSLVDITGVKRMSQELMGMTDHLEEMVATRTAELNIANLSLRHEILLREDSERKVASLYSNEQEFRKKLEAQALERVTFTRALVHELKTPLTPLLAASEYLTVNLGGIPLEFAQAVSRGATRLEHRINELLDFTRGEVGILELKLHEIDFLQLLQNIVTDVRPRVTKERQTIEINMEDNLPLVNGDPDRLQQVILNLIDNAIKFNRPGGKITINARPKKHLIIVEVADEGNGIDPELLPLLFDPYKRSERKWNTAGGLGVGLALSKSLVKLHSGDIWADNAKGRGSVFSFSLPV